MKRVALVSVFLASMWSISGLAARQAAGTSHLPRVYVSTEASGGGTELRDRQQSVKDLRDALAHKKKTLTVVDHEEQADVTVEVIDRTTTVPKFHIGLSNPGVGMGPERLATLRVKVTRGEGDPVEMTNKTSAFETSGGWQTAAEDIAKQIEKLVTDHKGHLS
jgi:hypothetical protein